MARPPTDFRKVPKPEAPPRKLGAARPAIKDVIAQLGSNRRQALEAVSRMGGPKLNRLLKQAQLDLERRLPRISEGAEFTIAAQRQTLAQLKLVAKSLSVGVEGVVREQAHGAAGRGADGTMQYLVDAERAFKGVSSLGPRIEDAMQLDVAVAGADATVLRRVATDPGYRGTEALAGVMDRYGIAVVSQFEGVMQRAMLSNQPWGDVRDSLTAESEWLQGNPRFWSERILRTETMAAYGRAGDESMQQAQDVVGPMLKILSCVLDDRTGSDSLAIHGEVRRLEEPFEGWNGLFMTAPDRPNDRGVGVPHMADWPIPPELHPYPWGVVMARWAREKRKGSPPARPLMSTVARLGKAAG